jgi:uncharacterized membrane protein YphA (DoxX/SURF4 family)
MSDPRGYSLVAAALSLAKWWHDFFHAPQDVRVCAAVRMAYAAVLLVNLAVLYPDLDLWFTDDGILPVAASRQIGEPFQWSILWHLPAKSGVVHTCFWILTAHTALLLVGLLSRVNAACVLIWLLSFHNRNVQILDGEDFVFRLICFYLILMPSGAAWSIDAWIVRVWRGAATPEDYLRPAWGLRLLQVQMAVIFLSAGMHKLTAEAWFDGTAIYYVARLWDYFGKFPVPTWAFDTPWTVALMTWGVVLGELLVPVLIWFRETRRLALLVAVLFHLSNEWTMHLFLFHWIMLVGWLSFLQPADFAWLRRKT